VCVCVCVCIVVHYWKKKSLNINLVFWTKLQILSYQRTKVMFRVMF